MLEKIFVFDLGPDTTRFGWAHDTGPAYSFPSNDAGIGRDGYIERWGPFAAKLQFAVESTLKAPEGYDRVGVIVIPPLTTKARVDSILEICFVVLAFGKLSVRLHGPLILLRSDLETGVSVRVDAEVAYISSVYKKYTLPDAVVHLDLPVGLKASGLSFNKGGVLPDAACLLLADAIVLSIVRCDPAIQGELYKNIVFAGSRANESGLYNKLRDAIALAVPEGVNFNLILAHYPEEVSWRGGAKFAVSSASSDEFITQQEYEGEGGKVRVKVK